jgi:hypothetical protein
VPPPMHITWHTDSGLVIAGGPGWSLLQWHETCPESTGARAYTTCFLRQVLHRASDACPQLSGYAVLASLGYQARPRQICVPQIHDGWAMCSAFKRVECRPRIVYFALMVPTCPQDTFARINLPRRVPVAGTSDSNH